MGVQILEDFELISRITDEISMFLDEIGVDPRSCSYDYVYDPDMRSYSAVVVLKSPVDEDIITEFNDNQEEFADHLDVTFPGVSVSLTAKIEDTEYGAGYATLDGVQDADMNFMADASDEYADEIDSAEKQYEEEGLTIISDDADDEEYILIPGDDSEDDEDDDDEDSELDYLAPQDDEDDGYTPSAEDMEELWSAFGVTDDE